PSTPHIYTHSLHDALPIYAPRRADANTATAKLDRIARQLRFFGAAIVAAATPADFVSRWSRFKSARSSAAVWQRNSRSFSSDLLIVRSSSGGNSAFRLRGEVGVRFRIASKITADVLPEKVCRPEC